MNLNNKTNTILANITLEFSRGKHAPSEHIAMEAFINLEHISQI